MKIVKFAFMNAIVIYAVVAYFVCQQPMQGEPHDWSMLSYAMMAVYALTVIVVEPLVSSQMTLRRGGYNKDVMIIKLAILETGAIMGLFLTFLTHNMNFVCGFGLVAFILIALRVPVAPDR